MMQPPELRADKSQLLAGDAFELIDRVPEKSVNAIITSPSYFGIRYHPYEDILKGDWVSKCVGFEDDEYEYGEKLRTLFQKARRVLKDDGVLWLKIGDEVHNATRNPVPTIKNGNLVGTPWSVAFQLRNGGWNLKSEVIWHRSNAPRSPTCDRPVPSHESIFMFTQQMDHYWDASKAPETVVSAPIERELHVQYDFPFGVFPQPVLSQLIECSVPPGGVVLDPFCGIGSVGVACKRLGRTFWGIELNAEYAIRAVMRIKSTPA